MELTNEFRAELPVDRAWAVLTDVERVGSCVPGAQVESVAGDEAHGTMRVTIGRTTARYRGVVRVMERDAAARTVTVRAEGKETQGNGGVVATVGAALRPAGEAATDVSVRLEVTFTGRFSRADLDALATAASGIVSGFAACLNSTVAAGERGDPTASGAEGASEQAPAAGQPAVEAEEPAVEEPAVEAEEPAVEEPAVEAEEPAAEAEAGPQTSSEQPHTPRRSLERFDAATVPPQPRPGPRALALIALAVLIVLLAWLRRRRRS